MMQMKRTLLVSLLGVFASTACSFSGNSPVPADVNLDLLKQQAAQVNLDAEDLPDSFVEYVPADGRMLGEDSLFDVQNEFSFKTEVGNLQTIIGMTTVYPYTQRDATDGIERIRSQMDVLTRSITKGYTFGRNVDVEEMKLATPVGDAYAGRTFNESMDDIGFPEYHTRTEILVFERNRITVILLVQYVEELPVSASIREVAEILDRKILGLESPSGDF